MTHTVCKSEEVTGKLEKLASELEAGGNEKGASIAKFTWDAIQSDSPVKLNPNRLDKETLESLAWRRNALSDEVRTFREDAARRIEIKRGYAFDLDSGSLGS